MVASVETSTATERECPRCGSAADPFQEYCLECGARLAPAGSAGPGPGAAWLWPVMVTAVVAMVAAGVIVAAQLTTDEPRPILTATAAQPPLPATTTAPEPVPTTAPEPPPQTAPPPPAQPPPNRLIAWPEGTRGWTVVLASLPQRGGRAAATVKAREAADAGLTEVGVLQSSQYSSLHPGYFVVFSGVSDARGQAEEGVTQARARGYQAAYAREIAP